MSLEGLNPVIEPDISMFDKLGITLSEICGAVAQLNEYHDKISQPPSRHVIFLSPAAPIRQDQSGETHLSLGVRNNGSVPVYVGIGGETPRRNSGAAVVPAGSLVVLPARVRDVTVGIDPADVGSIEDGGFQVDLYRWKTVQAPLIQPTEIIATVEGGGGGGADGGTP